MTGVLLDLAAVQHAFQTARLLRQLEQPLPLILGERSLLESCACGILSLALLLPAVDLGLLTGERTLVVLEVVGLGVVSLNAVEEKVAVLLQEGVSIKRQVVEVGSEDGGFGKRAGFQGGQGRGEVRRTHWAGGLELVDVRGDQVRVVDFDGKFDKDVLVSQVGFLQPINWLAKTRKKHTQDQAYSSAVNLFSLKAVKNLGDNRKARRLRLP